MCMCAKALQCVQVFGFLWTIAHQAPLSMGFSKQEYCSGFPCPPREDLPHPGIEPLSPGSPTLAAGFFTTSDTWETLRHSAGLNNMSIGVSGNSSF